MICVYMTVRSILQLFLKAEVSIRGQRPFRFCVCLSLSASVYVITVRGQLTAEILNFRQRHRNDSNPNLVYIQHLANGVFVNGDE